MDVLIVSNYWHLESEKSSSRYLTIANMCADMGMDVEVVTSSFYHTAKKQRTVSQTELERYKYKTTFVQEPGYRKNIDLKRILSHKKFAKNVITYLQKRKKPDVIYLFVPPIGLADAVVRYANSNGIRIVIDILDLWPEAYNMVLPLPQMTHYLLEPMRKRANRAYAGADDIVAVSQTYVDRAMRYNHKCKKGIPVYIGTDLRVFDKYAAEKTEKEPYIVFVYIGMLGKSYDLRCAIDAMEMLKAKGVKNAKLLVMGDGPDKAEFEDYAKKKKICCEFTGRLSYGDMVKRLVTCDVALNIISRGAVQSIINKHADYLSAGLPIINNQEVAEFGDILEQKNCGINCKNNDAVSVADAMLRLAEDAPLRRTMGQNARKVAEIDFDRKSSYSRIVNLIQNTEE